MAYDPSVYQNIPESEHTSLKSDYIFYAKLVRRYHAMKELFLMFDLLPVLHEILRDRKSASTLDPLEHEAIRIDHIERHNFNAGQTEYSGEYQKAIKDWRRALFATAKERGYE